MVSRKATGGRYRSEFNGLAAKFHGGSALGDFGNDYSGEGAGGIGSMRGGPERDPADLKNEIPRAAADHLLAGPGTGRSMRSKTMVCHLRSENKRMLLDVHSRAPGESVIAAMSPSFS